jgi:hypothetical protein
VQHLCASGSQILAALVQVSVVLGRPLRRVHTLCLRDPLLLLLLLLL